MSAKPDTAAEPRGVRLDPADLPSAPRGIVALADGDPIVIQMLQSVVGYGDKGAVLSLIQTPAVDAMIAEGLAIVYVGPTPPTPAAVAVSTGPQILTPIQQAQATANIGAVSLAAGGTFRGPVRIRADDLPSPSTNGVIVKSFGDGTVAANWLIHDDSVGYLFHLGPGPNFGSAYVPGSGLAMIGIGLQAGNQNGAGILVDNRGTGGASGPGTTGIVVTNFPTTTSNAVALLQQGTGGKANTLLDLEQLAAGGSPLLGLANPLAVLSAVGQQTAWIEDGSAIGFAGEMRFDTGELNWNRAVRVFGAHVAARDYLGSPNLSKAILEARGGYHPTFRDGVITGGTTLTSLSAAFTAADNGRIIYGGGIPAGTTTTYVNATTVTLSAASTNASNVEFTLYRAGVATPSPHMTLYVDDTTNTKTFPLQLSLAGTATYSAWSLQSATVATYPGLETFNATFLNGNTFGGTTRLGLYGAAAVVQAARVGQLTDSTGGTVSTTLAAGITDTVAKNAIASLAAKINAIETALHNIGVTA